jgi:3-dehydroquinate synthase
MHEIQQSFSVRHSYPVIFTRDAFDPGCEAIPRALADAGQGPHRVWCVIDAGLLAADPGLEERVVSFARAHESEFTLVADPLVVAGGEEAKRDSRVVDFVHQSVADHALCRHSFILAIGGGAMLDAVGFAAATAHRGIRLIRMPSTTLAQNDAGVGIKNAINALGRKNFAGTFAPPWAVINDFSLLASLEERDRRAGIAEAVKVALIKDAGFLARLIDTRSELAAGETKASEAMIVRCAEIHLEHIRCGGDPFELGSARPLDFGHWIAHKLEEVSRGELRHGEAVAVGIAVDTLYSSRIGNITREESAQVTGLLEDLGFELATPWLADLDVERALADFREHLGGDLCITLLAGLGQGMETRSIDAAMMRDCIESLLRSPARM